MLRSHLLLTTLALKSVSLLAADNTPLPPQQVTGAGQDIIEFLVQNPKVAMELNQCGTPWVTAVTIQNMAEGWDRVELKGAHSRGSFPTTRFTMIVDRKVTGVDEPLFTFTQVLNYEYIDPYSICYNAGKGTSKNQGL